MTDVDNPQDRGSGWQARRRQIIKRDENTCRQCGDSPDRYEKYIPIGIEVHHIVKGRDLPKTRARMDCNLVSLCSRCHNVIERRSPEEQFMLVGEEELADTLVLLKEGRVTIGYVCDAVGMGLMEGCFVLHKLELLDLVRKVHKPTGLYELAGGS